MEKEPKDKEDKKLEGTDLGGEDALRSRYTKITDADPYTIQELTPKEIEAKLVNLRKILAKQTKKNLEQ